MLPVNPGERYWKSESILKFPHYGTVKPRWSDLSSIFVEKLVCTPQEIISVSFGPFSAKISFFQLFLAFFRQWSIFISRHKFFPEPRPTSFDRAKQRAPSSFKLPGLLITWTRNSCISKGKFRDFFNFLIVNLIRDLNLIIKCDNLFEIGRPSHLIFRRPLTRAIAASGLSLGAQLLYKHIIRHRGFRLGMVVNKYHIINSWKSLSWASSSAFCPLIIRGPGLVFVPSFAFCPLFMFLHFSKGKQPNRQKREPRIIFWPIEPGPLFGVGLVNQPPHR